MCVFLDRNHEGQKSPQNRRHRQRDKPGESLSQLSVTSNGTAAHMNGGDKENIELDADADDDNDDVDEEMEVDVQTDREIKELSKMTDSGAAKVILEELRRKKLEKASLDPRSSSRTPSASTEPPYRPRYDSSMFACE